ncbi:glutamate synthase (NADPH/NADH) large chain [Glaciecola punicea ACAM 611]|jgi:glutamate synthase (NADPH/NADH) large chain|uniref:Glutamate synthase [NADPH] large chain n=1 Tax=Glaciecola punicea ACAM 611 TaxID=1121923 RepID=H5T8J6_9ALTE|nr:glutamate synthase large subunit [Glaciecola punicea]GAB54637.1 glutamate synthase (NADPH/NADH) large chain [Glaciecola punicea ACAM 611]
MGLYHSSDSKDNCGFGLIAHTQGKASHVLVATAIEGLARMQHRGGVAADGKTGDGCGLLLQKPDSFFRKVASDHGWTLNKNYSVGMVFLSQDPIKAQTSRLILTEELEKEMLSVLGWRLVPVNHSVLGDLAKTGVPQIEQVFINAPSGWSVADVERRLYMARRRTEKRIADDGNFYVASLSTSVTIYKGLVMPKDLPRFYLDLANTELKSAICVFHQRFSTNTLPQWPLAQPFRYLAHNGEINTIKGNRDWAYARTSKFATPLIPDLMQAAPFVNLKGSDSSSLDNMLELFLAGGMDLFRAMRLLVPPAYQNNKTMDPDLRAFYEFNSMHMEPWDGPAGIVLTDGRHVACNLDRNGLRPARYVITKNGFITLASEVGIWDYSEHDVIEKGRVGPGEMLAVDTQTGKIWRSNEIDDELKSQHPYAQWLESHISKLIPLEGCDASLIGKRAYDDYEMSTLHKLFNYSYEEINQVIKVLAKDGQEATGSMGDDTPMAVMSSKHRTLYDYFRQQFAQVTNPPIDSLRENHVMSLATCIGREQNVFNETSGHAHRVLFESPVLVYTDLKQLRNFDKEYYYNETININYKTEEGLEKAIRRLCDEVVDAVRNRNAAFVILSDRKIAKDTLPIPAAMAVGAVQRRLINEQLRCDANIVVETGSARDPHHFAVLIGLGATAIYPYLAYETIEQMVEKNDLDMTPLDALKNYRKGINKGLYKIMSKMGISTIASYRSSKLFEAIGINKAVVDLCFLGVPSRIQGAGFEDFEQDLINVSRIAWLARKSMSHGGLLKYVHGGEFHAYNPDVVKSLQTAVKSGKYEDYKVFSSLVNDRNPSHLRDLLGIRAGTAIDISEVEPNEQLFPRFDTAAMSMGSLSPEAHEALAIAMNRLGGQSNSGEGGEDPKRFNTEKNSKIKQVASGRFGVTPHYLMNANVIQIKVAQGAKPGEGGQLPGGKVNEYIAELRYSVPGVTLISPPPHHDIYSIEDLAQLIFDLKQINPSALISVKLVSEPGVGTIATGVAKAYADLITISGYDGGTGASPLSSVKYAGSPFELGLAETQQALVENGLRHKVRLQTDGGLKTGLDVVKAGMLGAESFGFGTGPMVALGCKYLRLCHLNNCATGVATQDAGLRENYFIGLPEMVMNYFIFIAQEVREIMASIGVRHFQDLVGRTDLLELLEGQTAKQSKLDLSPLLEKPSAGSHTQLFCSEVTNDPIDKGELNQRIVTDCEGAVVAKKPKSLSYKVRNTDRSVGATLSGLIAQRYGNLGMTDSPIKITLTGTVGQSFGVWNAGGLEMTLIGDANDYVGKGMAGGRLVIRPLPNVSFDIHSSAIMGNTCLYGATGGKLYAAGRAGERFAVRNSGAIAVIEGAGDNACEYMTGGIVAILGSIGLNFGAGMTGGFAYLYDELGDIDRRINHDLVDVLSISDKVILSEHLRGLINSHYNATGSVNSFNLLTNFADEVAKFQLVKPKTSDVKNLLGHISRSTAELRVQAQ